MNAREDNILPCLRDFFQQLDIGPQSSSFLRPSGEAKKGSELCDELFEMALSEFRGITIDKIENLRIRSRLTVVQKMEASNRQSQIRTLEEAAEFTNREIGVIYDEFKKAQYLEQNEEIDPTRDENIDKNKIPGGVVGQKMFVKMMKEICPWKQAAIVRPASNVRHQERAKFRRINITILLSSLESRPIHSSLVLRAHPILFDHIYHYAEKQLVDIVPLGTGVDLPTIVRLLNIICKQSSNARIRLFFNLHDVDGDSVLDKQGLFDLVDSFLWLLCGGLAIETSPTGDASLPAEKMDKDATTSGRISVQRRTSAYATFLTQTGSGSSVGQQQDENWVRSLTSFVKRLLPATGSMASISEESEHSANKPELSENVKADAMDGGETAETANNQLLSAPMSTLALTASDVSLNHPHPADGESTLWQDVEYLVPPIYLELADAIKAVDRLEAFRLAWNDFLVLVLSEPLLMGFFGRAGEM